MKKNNEELIALCAQYGIEGIDIVNELMRFKVLDQLLSAMRILVNGVLHQRTYMD